MNRRNTKEDLREERERQRAFVPPCCPVPDCPTLRGEKFAWVRNGWHERAQAPFEVQRFRCLICRKTFSTQTFDGSYWQRRPELDRLIFNQSQGRSCDRQIARIVGCGKSTVPRKIARLARQGIRFHVRQLAEGPRLGGDILFDGLRGREGSKYVEYDLNVAIHGDTSFTLGISEALLRRSGRMRPEQRAKRSRIEAAQGLPSGRATRISIAELLSAIAPNLDREGIRFVTDEHKAYPPAIRDAGFAGVPHLEVSSRRRRDHRNPLFEINLADMLFRHYHSCQTRKTIAFSRRRMAGLERAWCLVILRNYMQRRRVNGGPETPAMLAGMADRVFAWEQIFQQRILPHEAVLPPVWDRHLRREVTSNAYPNNASHKATLAF